MDIDELKHRLGQILATEEQDMAVDWPSIESQSNSLLRELRMPVPVIVDEYLRGSHQRRQDIMFGHSQRSELLVFLREPDA